MLRRMRAVRRFRERLVLGQVRHGLDGDEHVRAWTHAKVPETRAPGLLVVTNHRCLLHIASSSIPDVETSLNELSSFKLDRRDPERVQVRLCAGIEESEEVTVELSLTDRKRSRSVGSVLGELTRHRVRAPESFDAGLTSPLPPMQRKARHHARRVWVTILGVLVLMVSAVFASPIVPGPGALTAVAGIAILAREYEWARDLHVWAARQADRFITWMRSLRANRRAARAERRATKVSMDNARGTVRPDRERPTVIEATVPPPGASCEDDSGRGAYAS